MSKLGVGVGEEFPVEEPPETTDHDDDRRREYEEWRARARAFKDDVRSAARKHFGDRSYTAHNYFVMRALAAIAIVAIAIALLPHFLLLAALAIGIILFLAHRGHFHHHDYCDAPRPDARV